MQKIILASQSPRRKQLLEWAEVDFEVMVSDTDESFPPTLTFEEAAIFIARNKALAVAAQLTVSLPILAADTIVVCNNAIIGKPKNREEAIDFLTRLSGNIHQVITGVVILKAEKEIAFADITTVTFHSLTKEQIIFYVDKYKPFDKAGAYAIQEWIGVVGIHSIDGDFYNVMGLPVSRVVQALSNFDECIQG
jgi:septum formation protein